ncbi:MAG: NTP transferase domain-containing protein, partial [Deltaproteobacteria bacterium]|nr:NTP transferase domain-containing protein [Deltaproteobacteria bacterium]
ILAAGLGTRMKSGKAKVLHEILGKPMISYGVETAREIAGNNVFVVIGHQAQEVKRVCSTTGKIRFAVQEKQMGTGHAVLCAVPDIPDDIEHVIILCGDVPLLKTKTIQHLLDDHQENGRTLSLLAVEFDNPKGYGRVVIDDQRNMSKIVEESDATDVEKEIKLINSGIYCVDKVFLSESLLKLTPDNAQGELYLTDIIEIGYREKRKIGVLVSEDAIEVSGVNTIDDLVFVEDVLKKSA